MRKGFRLSRFLLTCRFQVQRLMRLPSMRSAGTVSPQPGRAVEQVLAGAIANKMAAALRDRPHNAFATGETNTQFGPDCLCACVGAIARTTLAPCFWECIRRLYILPTRLTMAAIQEHTEMRQCDAPLTAETGQRSSFPPTNKCARRVIRLKMSRKSWQCANGPNRFLVSRESPQSFALSIPAPALLTQVDEHSLELYVVTPDGIAVTDVFMLLCLCASKRQRSWVPFWPSARSKRRTTCVWSSKH